MPDSEAGSILVLHKTPEDMDVFRDGYFEESEAYQAPESILLTRVNKMLEYFSEPARETLDEAIEVWNEMCKWGTQLKVGRVMTYDELVQRGVINHHEIF